MQKKFLPIEEYLQTNPWDQPVEPEVQARFESWVAAQDRQAEEDFQALIGISIQEVPEPQFEDFRIMVSKVRRTLVARGVPPQKVIEGIQTLMDDYAADRLILLRKQHNDIFDDVGRLAGLRYRAKCWASGDETAFLGQIGVWQRQRRLAKRPRTDALQEVIIEIVRKDPAITTPTLLGMLGKQAGPGRVIEYMKDGEIGWTDRNRKPRDTPTHAVKDRLSRAKKALGLTHRKSR